MLCKDAITDAIKLFGINWKLQLPDVTDSAMNIETLSMRNHYHDVERYYGYDSYVAPIVRDDSTVVSRGTGDPRTITIANRPYPSTGLTDTLKSYYTSRPSKSFYLTLGGAGMLAFGFAAPILATAVYAYHKASYNNNRYGQTANNYRRPVRY